jgi:hypothetical protein
MTTNKKPADLPAKFRILKPGSGLTRRLPFTADGVATHGVTFAKWTTGFAVADPAGKWLAITGEVSDDVAEYVTDAFNKRAVINAMTDETGECVGFHAVVPARSTNKKESK